MLSGVQALRKPDNDNDRKKEEFERLLALFNALIKSIKEDNGQWENLEELIAERADIGIRHAFDGYGIDYEEAIEIIRNEEGLTDEQRVDRDILIAAVDNIVDFSTAEEYQMACEIPDFDELFDPDSSDYDDDDMEEYLAGLCATYNKRYAWAENMDIEFAMIVAAYLARVGEDTVLTYMTQGDDRVRPWHLQYEGFTAPRSKFPDWLIPPIEWGCRCFLVEDTVSSVGSVMAKNGSVPEIPDWFDRTFKESVANGGRIFSDEHPYFNVKNEHVEKLGEIADRVKKKYFANE